MKRKFIVLSGPSGVGKTPLLKALRRMHPKLEFGTLTLYIGRQPRPGEKDGVDFHFSTEQEIRSLPAERFLVGKRRVVWQAIDLIEVRQVLQAEPLVIVEIYPTLGREVMSHPAVQGLLGDFEVRTVFLSPLPSVSSTRWLGGPESPGGLGGNYVADTGAALFAAGKTPHPCGTG